MTSPDLAYEAAQARIVPEMPICRVTLETAQPLRTTRAELGTVHLSGRSKSILRTVWRRVVTVPVRESGFRERIAHWR